MLTECEAQISPIKVIFKAEIHAKELVKVENEGVFLKLFRLQKP
jgi:hypothetical protein